MAHEAFDVGGMTCAACQAHVEKAVSKLPGVTNVAVNLLSGSMTVDFDEAHSPTTTSAPPWIAPATPPRPSRRQPAPIAQPPPVPPPARLD